MSKAEEALTWEVLTEHFLYEPETGDFYRIKGAKTKVGKPCGILRKTGYVQVVLKKEIFIAHRLAWFYMHKEWPNFYIDHINGDKGDNRIANLRDVNAKLNAQNRYRPQSNSQTGYLGVIHSMGKFVASIKVGDKNINLGRFSTVEEAGAAYMDAKRRFHEGCTQ